MGFVVRYEVCGSGCYQNGERIGGEMRDEVGGEVGRVGRTVVSGWKTTRKSTRRKP